MRRRTVTDSDTASGSEGLTVLHTGHGHTPHHPTPGPIPHPAPLPRGFRKLTPGGVVKHAH